MSLQTQMLADEQLQILCQSLNGKRVMYLQGTDELIEAELNITGIETNDIEMIANLTGLNALKYENEQHIHVVFLASLPPVDSPDEMIEYLFEKTITNDDFKYRDPELSNKVKNSLPLTCTAQPCTHANQKRLLANFMKNPRSMRCMNGNELMSYIITISEDPKFFESCYKLMPHLLSIVKGNEVDRITTFINTSPEPNYALNNYTQIFHKIIELNESKDYETLKHYETLRSRLQKRYISLSISALKRSPSVTFLNKYSADITVFDHFGWLIEEKDVKFLLDNAIKINGRAMENFTKVIGSQLGNESFRDKNRPLVILILEYTLKSGSKITAKLYDDNYKSCVDSVLSNEHAPNFGNILKTMDKYHRTSLNYRKKYSYFYDQVEPKYKYLELGLENEDDQHDLT